MGFKKNIGFGCVSLTTQTFERTALKLLETAFDQGITHFDTAPVYGQGYSEKILGKFIKEKRKEVTVTTKFGLSPTTIRNIPASLALPLNSIKKKIKNEKSSGTTSGQSSMKISFREITLAEVKDSFTNSLRNLNTAYIDYYLLHEALPHFLNEGVIEYLMELREKGMINKIGVATSAINLKDLKEHDIKNWDILQYESDYHIPSAELQTVFPAKQHFHHSVLKHLKNLDQNGKTAEQKASALLTLALRKNPDGKVLFSTTMATHLINNLKHIEKMINCSDDQLKNIIFKQCHS